MVSNYIHTFNAKKNLFVIVGTYVRNKQPLPFTRCIQKIEMLLEKTVIV